MNKNLLAGILCIVVLTGCVTPGYHSVGEKSKDMKATDVNFKLSGLFYQDPPDCVIVLDMPADKNPDMVKMVPTALARHLGEKVDRVIFPRKRKVLERKLGFDLTHKTDRQRFSTRIGCRFYAVAQLYDFGDEYAGVFAKKHMGVKVDILRIEDDEPVWQAAHTVWRADGGVPLSPFSAIGGIASATLFNADPEVIPSLLDDVMRRMMRTLPPSIES